MREMHMQWTGLVREEGKNGYCWFLTYDEEGCLPHSCRSPERNPSFIVQRRIMHPFVLINSVRAFILEFSLHFPNQRCYSWDIGEMVFFFEGLLSILELSLSLSVQLVVCMIDMSMSGCLTWKKRKSYGAFVDRRIQ